MNCINLIKQNRLGLVTWLCLSASGIAHAAITAPLTIDFLGMNAGQPGAAAAYYGKANIGETDAQGCTTVTTHCYFEDSFSIGSVIDPADASAHLHRGGSAAARLLEYHGDSGGIYIRATDLSNFSLDSFKVDTTNLSGTNPAAGDPASYFEILGFRDAINADLTTWNWTADPIYGGKRIAYQTFANANNVATITLNDQFKNVKAIWIHYVGYPKVPTDGVDFDIKVGSISLSPPPAIPCP